MYKTITALLISIISLGIQAQSFTIKGKLTSAEGVGLPSATILLLNTKDSVMVNYALSNNQGNFEMRNVSRGDHFLRFSYMGYTTVNQKVQHPEGNILDLGTIKLSEEQKLLREVVVEQERIPMRVRNDTIEYDALAFRPLPNEMVEDLLKRMPGIEVETDGSVTAQGEQVRRVLVDGKEFFGRDPKMATQNLPADAVSKIHVFDQKSEQALFSGIDDGQRERTMNLELKEDRKEAAFGSTSLGYGPDNRFQGRANLNRFNSKGQVSLLAMGNNLNQQGFSIGEYMNFSGGAQSLASGRGNVDVRIGRNNSMPINFDGLSSSNGLMTSWAGGLNVNRKIKDKTEITASYFYNQLDHDMFQELQRENYLPQGNYNYNQNLLQDNQNYNHRLNLRMEHKFSETSSLLFTSSGLLNRTNTLQSTQSQTFNTSGGIQNAGEQRIESDGGRYDFSGNLLWRQRLAKPGRTLTANMDFQNGNNTQNSNLNAINRFYQETYYEEPILQDEDRKDNSTSVSTGLTYTEPLGRRIFLEGNYQVSYTNSEVNRKVFDLDEQDTDVIFNPLLSNHYINAYTYQRGGANLLINRDLFNITLGSAVQASVLRGTLKTFDEDISRDYTHILPVARFNYNFTNMRRISFDYETSVQEPSTLQIQPIIDNRDPLNIYEGNPDLRPSYRHRWQMRFNSFNPQTSFGYFAFLSTDLTNNAIANSVNVDELLIRTTKPVNVGTNLNMRGSFNLNFSVSKLKSRIMLGTSISRVESVNALNNVYQDIINNTLGGNARYIFRPTDDLELRLSANLNRQLTQYEFSADELAFLNQTYRADGNWKFLKYYTLQSGFGYQIYQGRSAEFDRKIPMLDMSFARSFLKNNSGELKLSVFNLMDKNLGVTQTQSANYYENAVTNSLGRYFLLTFTYSLNHQLNMMERGPGRGRGMMIVH